VITLAEPLARMAKESLPDRLARQIRGWIEGGEGSVAAHAGERLPSIVEMARRFGVAQPSIREALRTLEAMGVVEIRHGAGVFVRRASTPADEPPIADLVSARLTVEVHAAADAARHATPAHVDTLRRLLDGADEHDPHARADADAALHRQIALASGNSVLVRLLDTLHDITTPAQRALLVRVHDVVTERREHVAIVDAIAARDEELAAERMRAHFRPHLGAPARALAALLLLAGSLVLTACGGGGGDPVQPIVEKTCQQDPTQAKCVVTPPPTVTTLRALAAAKGRYFGTALDATFFGANPAAYDTLVAHEFSMVVAGNVMKWSSIHRDGRYAYRWTNPDNLVAFAQANGMKVRGHTLFWYQQNPTWLTSGAWSAETLKVLLKEHVDSVVGHYKGKIHAWDVVNEALNDGSGTLRTTSNPWATALGASYIDSAFAEARRVDPAALLFYNDYNLEFAGAKQDAAFTMIQGMKARGIPIDGIGFQAHFQVNDDGGGMPSRQAMIDVFNRFAALGLKVELTELDIRIRTPGATAAAQAAQVQGYNDVVSACLAVAACDAIVVWGVNDGESWVPGTFQGYGQPLLFDDSFGRKATYNAVKTALGG